MSAVTMSPASSRTRSPGTSSGAGTRSVSPSRTTRAVGLAIRLRASSACSARYSWTNPTIPLRTTIARMTNVSLRSPRRAVMTAATIRTTIIAFVNCSTSRRQGGFFPRSTSSLRPWRSRRAAASGAARPRVGSVASAAATSVPSMAHGRIAVSRGRLMPVQDGRSSPRRQGARGPIGRGRSSRPATGQVPRPPSRPLAGGPAAAPRASPAPPRHLAVGRAAGWHHGRHGRDTPLPDPPGHLRDRARVPRSPGHRLRRGAHGRRVRRLAADHRAGPPRRRLRRREPGRRRRRLHVPPHRPGRRGRRRPASRPWAWSRATGGRACCARSCASSSTTCAGAASPSPSCGHRRAPSTSASGTASGR